MSYSGIHLLDPKRRLSTWYNRKFAFFPVRCGEEKVWLKYYYVKNTMFANTPERFGVNYALTHISRITEADYIVDKLTEGF